VDLAKMEAGGLDAVFLAVFVSNKHDDRQPSKEALETVDAILRQAARHPDRAALALTAADIRRLHREGRKALLIGMENGSPVEGSLALLRNFHRLGVRYITLTHAGNNAIADSSFADGSKWNGLSPFGREVVREMNRLGMMVDVSHLSDAAVRDALAVSAAPIFCSHSCARALCDIPRNLPDDLASAIAAKGGVVQVTYYSGFLDKVVYDAGEEAEKRLQPQFDALKEKHKGDSAAYWAEASALWKSAMPEPLSIDRLIDHIDHFVKVCGIDHVGLGSDYDGAGSFPRGLEDASGYPLITYHLLKRGYSEEDVKKVLGGNFLRFMERVEGASDRLRATGHRPQAEGRRLRAEGGKAETPSQTDFGAQDIIARLMDDHAYQDWIDWICITVVNEYGKDPGFAEVTLYEKHEAPCKGAPATAPRIDTFRISISTGEIQWFDAAGSADWESYQNFLEKRAR
jgi:membrane dipeptidase